MSELAKALAKFHTDLPEVKKDATNPHFGSKYADLADIVKVVLPKLAAVGLTWIATPTMTEDGFVLAYELRHESGESVTGAWPLPDPERAKPQELGSAVTYAKRYALSAVTGIALDQDDDGNAASAGPASAPRRTTRVQNPQEKIAAAVKAVGEATTPERLDEIEDRAKVLGIGGVKPVREAVAAKRAELGASLTDHWAAAEVPE